MIALSEWSLAASSSRAQLPPSTVALDVPELGAHALRDVREAWCLPTSPDLSAEPLLPEWLCAVVSAQKVNFHQISIRSGFAAELLTLSVHIVVEFLKSEIHETGIPCS